MAFSPKDYSAWVLLGEGGEACVYRARQTSLGRLVAIRAVKPVASERCEHEAELLSSLRHQGLAVLIDYGYAAGKFYLVQDYVRGVALSVLGPLPVLTSIRLMRFFARTLHFLHTRNIVHGDLNPGNILVTSATECVLVDFGMARRMGEPSGAGLGVPRYLAPEQYLGESLTAATDVFCLGSLFYRMLTGQDLFDDEHFDSIRTSILGLQNEQSQLALQGKFRDLNPQVVPILTRCLRFAALDRFEDMEELQEHLEIAEQAICRGVSAVRIDEILLGSQALLRTAIDGRERDILERTYLSAMASGNRTFALELLRELLALAPQDATVHHRLRLLNQKLRQARIGKQLLVVVGLFLLVALGSFIAWRLRVPESSMDQMGRSLLLESREMETQALPILNPHQLRVIEIPDLERFDEIRIDALPQQTENGMIRLAPGIHRFDGRLTGTQEWVRRQIIVPSHGDVAWK